VQAPIGRVVYYAYKVADSDVSAQLVYQTNSLNPGDTGHWFDQWQLEPRGDGTGCQVQITKPYGQDTIAYANLADAPVGDTWICYQMIDRHSVSVPLTGPIQVTCGCDDSGGGSGCRG
jgi:hypothetical protein